MLELVGIEKHFGQVHALKGVDLFAPKGCIHGIVGENGAGKSTLMKILTGFISKSSGKTIFNGQEKVLRSPKDAMILGIGMLHQEPLDFPQLLVLENFMAGAALFDPKQQAKALKQLCMDFGFNLNPLNRVATLTVGERQQLELLRLINNGASTLILDEPTTGISQKQQHLLFNALNRLREQGTTILLVSHKLEEIELLCDSVTVLKQGEVAATQKKPLNREKLLNAMFDNPPDTISAPSMREKGQTILSFDQVVSKTGRSGLKNISVDIHEGEVVALAGVDGSGQYDFLKTAFGLFAPVSGTVLRQLQTQDSTTGDATTEGQTRSVVFLPADRLAEGLFPELSIREHHFLASENTVFFSKKSGSKSSQQAIHNFNIKGTPDSRTRELSGGNQQRVLLSLIPETAKLILMENPTRGLDVLSAAWTWQYLHESLSESATILFASPDLEEILNQANRVLVFYEGSIILDTPTSETDYHQLSKAITGQVT